MNTQDIKQEIRKDFDKLVEGMENYDVKLYAEEIKQFYDKKIDLVIAEERKKVAEEILSEGQDELGLIDKDLLLTRSVKKCLDIITNTK